MNFKAAKVHQKNLTALLHFIKGLKKIRPAMILDIILQKEEF